MLELGIILTETTPVWYETAAGIITLITSGVSLIGGIVAIIYSIITKVKALKGKSMSEVWALIMQTADAAMTSVESSGLSGADKKTMVIDAVKAVLKTNGINGDSFMDQLSAYIDSCISFANGLKDADSKK